MASVVVLPSTPSPTLPPTWTPTPIPTPTPVPPARLHFEVPAEISPLFPVHVEAGLSIPSGAHVEAEITATVMDPQSQIYVVLSLDPVGGGLYRSSEALELPLDPLPGFWFIILHVQSAFPTVGPRVGVFRPTPVSFQDLTDSIHAGVTLAVPSLFQTTVETGDPWAGGRVWAWGDGEVALWWAPGPVEPLELSLAQMILASSYTEDPRGTGIPVTTVMSPTTWQRRPAYWLQEQWSEEPPDKGEAWVIQGPDHWLYVLRVRARGRAAIPRLHREVIATFGFVENGP